MKKILLTCFILCISIGFFLSPSQADAQLVKPTDLPVVPTFAPTPTTAGLWVIDPEVTFIGKNARRSGHLLDWTLQNYNWVCVTSVANRQCDDRNNPLAQYWRTIVTYIVVPLLFVVILATAIVIIITRGRALTVMRFIPRFIAVILLIVFSYSLLQFFYQVTDLIQGFFLRSNTATPCPPDCISQADLLYIGWDYRTFVGLRLLGDQNSESAFMSLLLTKLTALTYFVMVGILLVRKVILWFFIIVSPIFPLLLMFYPIRNTGKIWIGEFFRWLLYAPLFAIFLNGLVFTWRNKIPLVFDNPAIQNPDAIIFPTAVNILLGGPKQFVTINNSVNLTETYALYVVALIMLWIVILLPWVLLQIFLDYANNFSAGDNPVMKSLVNKWSNQQVPPSPVGYPPTSPQEGGSAITLPFAKKFTMPINVQTQPAGSAKQIMPQPVDTSRFAMPLTLPTAQVNAQMLSLANIALPTMRDIAKYDTALRSTDTSRQQEVATIKQTLEKISNPVAVTSTVEKEKYSNLQERLVQESQQGNVLATSLLNAVKNVSQQRVNISTSQLKNVLTNIANPASVPNQVDRERFTKLHDTLTQASKENNNQLASSILSVSEKTSASEIEKIQQQLSQTQQQSNTLASSILSTISNANQQTQSVATSEMTRVIKQIANPNSVSNPADREHFTKLHDSLEKESKENNNQLATSILQVNDTTSMNELQKISEKLTQQQGNATMSSVTSTVQTTQLKKVLQQIAKPASATNPAERDKLTKLHDMLEKESKENNNQLATSILQVNDTTSMKELEKIHDQLTQAKDNTVVVNVNAVIRQQASADHLRSVFQQISNPASVKAIDKEKISKLHDELTKASQQGNNLATSILAVNATTATKDVDALKERIMQAKEKGEPLATELADMTQTENALPAINRVQTVKQEDYNAVKDMWKESYQSLETNKSEAMKDDITTIDRIVGMLSSTDEDQVNQGMAEVSNILPFLLVGGFSQTEVIAYLKAKQEAAKEVLQSVANEEEQQIAIQVKSTSTQNQQTMAATAESSTESERNESPQITFTPTIQVQTPDIFVITKLKLPTLRDIARYDTSIHPATGTKSPEVSAMRETLEKIANPIAVTSAAEKEKYTQLQERLIQESASGNVMAASLLNAVKNVSKHNAQISTSQLRSVFQQISNPASVKAIDKEKISKLHDELTKASQQGNVLASSILAVNATTATKDVDALKERIMQAKEKGEPLAAELADMTQTTEGLPTVNRVQTVSKEDYAAVKDLWKESYQSLETNKSEAMKDDITTIDRIVGLLSSTDQTQVAQGMQEVSSILPFLLVGGFSQTEVVSYLQAKQEAAKEVLQAVNKEEDQKISVTVKQTTAAQNQQTMTATTTTNADDEKDISPIMATPAVKANISNEILTLTKLKLPTIRDIARYDTAQLRHDKTELDEIEATRSILKNIANPKPLAGDQERQRFEQLQDKLLMESTNQNQTANVILAAATSLTQDMDQIAATLADIKIVLERIAKPEIVSPTDDKTFFTRLHAYLAKEQLEQNNQLAASILTVTSTTPATQIQTIKEQLLQDQAKIPSVSSEVIAAINAFVTTQQLRNLLQQITAGVPDISLHDEIFTASSTGNDLASTLLAVTESTSDQQILALYQQLTDALKHDDQLAKKILGNMSTVSISSIQKTTPISDEDYEAVKKLWENNYRNLPIPEGFTNNNNGRGDWIQSDSTQIDETITMLLSPEQEKKAQGIKHVSTILPFLLLGGFSFHDMITYLQLKLEAAHTVLTEVNQEEEKSLSIAATQTQVPQQQAVTIPDEETKQE